MSTTSLHPDIQPQVLNALVSELEDLQRREHEIHAERVALLAQCDDYAVKLHRHTSLSPDIAHRSTHSEVAVALRVASVTVSNYMNTAVSIVSRYPRTHALMRLGDLSQEHAAIINDAGKIIADPTRRHKYETAVLEYAVRESVASLRVTARNLAEAFTDLPLSERHERAKQQRHVKVQARDDGMAELRALLPAVETYGLFDRLTRMARKVKQAESESSSEASSKASTDATTNLADADAEAVHYADDSGLTASSATGVSTSAAACGTVSGSSAIGAAAVPARSIHEIRADVLSDLLLAGAPSPKLAGKGLGSIKAVVQVTVPDKNLTPIPLSDPGVTLLTTYGPIDQATARELASHEAKWLRVNTNPLTGEFVSIDSYEPSQKLRDQLRVRDFHCRFPGCRTPVTRCDLDHTVDAARGGPTNSLNLAHLCRSHHTLKHATDWDPVQLPGGVMQWTSPIGRSYTVHPASRVIFKEINEYESSPPSRPLNFTDAPTESAESLPLSTGSPFESSGSAPPGPDPDASPF